MRLMVRTLLLWTLIFTFLLHSLIGRLFIRNKKKQEKLSIQLTSYYSKAILSYLGFNIHPAMWMNSSTLPTQQSLNDARKHLHSVVQKKPPLLIANHVSYLDILIISSLIPSAFITSVEVQKTFFLGLASTLGGSLFVERRNRSGLHKEIENITQTLAAHTPVVLFPEGTSSNGQDILPFKPSLFETAIQGKLSIQPLCLRYTMLDGKPIDALNRDTLFYYGDLTFFSQALKLPKIKTVDVTVQILPLIDSAHFSHRKELAEYTHKLIRSHYLSGSV